MTHAVLFKPSRHEPLADRPFSEAAARTAIAQIAARAERELDPTDGRWPLDPADVEREGEGPGSGVYYGAAGIAWALGELADEGYAAPSLIDRGRVEALEARLLADPDDPDLGVGGVWTGVPGVLAVAEHRWPDPSRRDRLADLARASLSSPALEPMYGHPGHMVLAAQLNARTGEERWAEFWSAGAERLFREWRHDDSLGAWLWTQRLGTEEKRFVGAAHGLVGNCTSCCGVERSSPPVNARRSSAERSRACRGWRSSRTAGQTGPRSPAGRWTSARGSASSGATGPPAF